MSTIENIYQQNLERFRAWFVTDVLSRKNGIEISEAYFLTIDEYGNQWVLLKIVVKDLATGEDTNIVSDYPVVSDEDEWASICENFFKAQEFARGVRSAYRIL